MLDERFRALKQTRPPDLWPDIEGREPRPPRREIPWGRLSTAALALAVAAAGVAFAARAFFDGKPPPKPIDQPSGPVGNGLIAISAQGSVYVMEPDGSDLRPLTQTSPGQALYPWAWSPDGSRLAIRGYVDNPSLTGANYDVYVVDADGSGLRNLTTDASDVEAAASQGDPDWSPDGRMLAFTDDGGDQGDTNVIQVVSAEGTGRRTITDPSSPGFTPDPSPHGIQAYAPEWSPDGTTVAFARYLQGGSEIYSVAPDGSQLRRLTEGDSWNGEPAWSPDGSRIAFTSNRTGSNEIHVVAADGSGEEQLTNIGGKNIGDPEWSPDGTTLTFEVLDEGDWDIWEVNADSTGQAPLTDGPGDEIHPVWAPDGTRIAYVGSPIPSGEHDNSGTFDIYTMDPDGTEVERLTHDMQWGGGLAWQPVFGSESALIAEHPSSCPIEVAYAVASPADDPSRVRLVVGDNTPVVSALDGVISSVEASEESGWAEVTVRSTDVVLTYRFYLDSARGSLPGEGAEVASGDVIGGAHEFLRIEAQPAAGSESHDVPEMLRAWGCREGLPQTDVLRARLLDGSMWELQLARPIEVVGAQGAATYGDLTVDGEVVAGASRIGQRPDFSRPFAPGFDPPELIEQFALPDGRRVEHWNMAPSHENDTFDYVLWVEGPGEHMYFYSAQPIADAELVVRSLRMSEADGRIDAIWLASERVDVVKLEAVFFLIDPQAPMRGPEVRLYAACRVGHEPVPDCEEAELEVPAYTPGTEEALRGATIKRVGA